MERSELVGLSQFLAVIGGTLGLFLGFSFLTLAEIFYFFTVKMQPFDTDTNDAKNTKQLLYAVTNDFAENTSLNGVKYIAKKEASNYERFFWIFTFVVSTFLCVLMVYKSYVKYNESGVVITLKERLVSVKEYPFPAITVCPQARIDQKRYNLTHEGVYLWRDDPEDRPAAELQKFHSTVVLCNNDEGIKSTDKYPFIHQSVDINVFSEVTPRREDIITECTWRNDVDCVNKFRPVLTNDGICFTFNMLATDQMFREDSVYQQRSYLNTSTPLKDWSLKDNYHRSADDTFPRRGRANGARQDIIITLKEVEHRDFSCDEHTQPGYKVYLHHPADLPQASLHNYAVDPGKTTSLAIKLDIIDTAKELDSYNPNIRQCYFPEEKYLQFYQHYTSSNCHLECLTNYTVQMCNCVSYYMPRNQSTPICKSYEWGCVDKAVDKYASEEDSNDSNTSRCKCLPSCKEVEYDAEVIVKDLDLKEYWKRLKDINRLLEEENLLYTVKDYDLVKNLTQSSNNATVGGNETTSDIEASKNKSSINDYITEENIGVLQIYYRRPRFVAMERSELVGFSQFLADIGGTLGLFLGFSYLTLAEIFYFFTLSDPEDRPAAELQKFHSTVVLCNNDEGIKSTDKYPFIHQSVDINVFSEVTPRREDIITECTWRNDVDCVNKFRPVLTNDGICFTFNMLATDQMFREDSVYQQRSYLNTSTPLKDWSLKDNYHRSADDTFPRRGRANGARQDIIITLKEVEHRDFSCDEHTQPGYKVYLHHPADLPQASLHNYAVDPGKTTSLAIKLDIIDTAKELDSYNPNIRQCYFPEEKYLQFYQHYTSSNCHLECLTNYTVQMCNCVSYYMPRNQSTPICKSYEWGCVDKAVDKYASEEDSNDSNTSRCKCLPSCKEVEYDAEVIVKDLDLKEYWKRLKDINRLLEEENLLYTVKDYDLVKNLTQSSNNATVGGNETTSDIEASKNKSSINDYITEENIGVLQIYYRRPRFVAMERSELVGFSQFLADIGGTLGLFLGFSYLTLAEIFYFFTLRLCCQYRRGSSTKDLPKSNTDNNID